jgi:hypothetical protein
MGSIIMYEHKGNKQVYYVQAIEYFLVKLPVVRVSDTPLQCATTLRTLWAPRLTAGMAQETAASCGMSTQMH